MKKMSLGVNLIENKNFTYWNVLGHIYFKAVKSDCPLKTPSLDDLEQFSGPKEYPLHIL